MKTAEIIERFGCEPEDEYDRALIFSLKKWIADEINEMCDNGICSLSFSFENESLSAYIGYNTEKQRKEKGDGTGEWKRYRFASVNDDDAVDGSVEIWFDFKGYERPDEMSVTKFYRCVMNAYLSLVDDGIIKERFGKNIEAVFMGYDTEGFVHLAVDEKGEMTY